MMDNMKAEKRSRPDLILSSVVLLITAVMVPFIIQTVTESDSGFSMVLVILIAVLFLAALWYSMQYMLLAFLKRQVKVEWATLETSLARRRTYATSLTQEWLQALPVRAVLVAGISETMALAGKAPTKAEKLTSEAILGEKLKLFVAFVAKLPSADDISPQMRQVVPALRNIRDIGREIYTQQAGYDMVVTIFNNAIRGTRWSALPFIMAIVEEDMAGELV